MKMSHAARKSNGNPLQAFQTISLDSVGFQNPTWLQVKRDLCLQEVVGKSIQFYMLLKVQAFNLWILVKFWSFQIRDTSQFQSEMHLSLLCSEVEKN